MGKAASGRLLASACSAPCADRAGSPDGEHGADLRVVGIELNARELRGPADGEPLGVGFHDHARITEDPPPTPAPWATAIFL